MDTRERAKSLGMGIGFIVLVLLNVSGTLIMSLVNFHGYVMAVGVAACVWLVGRRLVGRRLGEDSDDLDRVVEGGRLPLERLIEVDQCLVRLGGGEG